MFIIALIVASDIGGLILYKKEVSKQQQSGAASIASLQKELATLQAQLALVSKQQSTVGMSAQEVVTSAVSKTTPSVVSIVISENVPKYKVVYKNPFGNDPFFKDFGIQVPVYEPTGETQSQKVGAGTALSSALTVIFSPTNTSSPTIKRVIRFSCRTANSKPPKLFIETHQRYCYY